MPWLCSSPVRVPHTTHHAPRTTQHLPRTTHHAPRTTTTGRADDAAMLKARADSHRALIGKHMWDDKQVCARFTNQPNRTPAPAPAPLHLHQPSNNANHEMARQKFNNGTHTPCANQRQGIYTNLFWNGTFNRRVSPTSFYSMMAKVCCVLCHVYSARAVLCCALYSASPCSAAYLAVPCRAVPCGAVFCRAVPCGVMPCRAVLCPE